MIFAIVSEYNPMHLGHVYQIKRIKKQFPDALVISLTSCSFVQRGEPSFISKHSKSKIAVENGIDLFLEMPTILSSQSAKYFAFHSINLLNKLNIVDYICFGVEDIDEEVIKNYIDFTKNNKEKIDLLIKTYMDQGLSYKASHLRAYQDLDFKEIEALSLPNNTLALEYAGAIDEISSDMKILPIKRKDSSYHDEFLNDSPFQSATAIRKSFKTKPEVWKYLPESSKKYANDMDRIDLDSLSDLFYYKAFVLDEKADSIASYENGMLNLLKSNYSSSITKMVEKSHNKRYSKSRLNRFIINYLLDIKESHIKNLNHLNYIRPLAFNDKGREILKSIKNKSDVTIINSLKEEEKLDKINANYLNIDIRAFKLFNIKKTEENLLDYTNNPYMGDI